MALLGNGLETIEVGSTGWRLVINSNLYKLFTKDEVVANIENPATDITFVSNNTGPILTDRSTNDQYRLYVDNGSLGIELI